MLFLTCSNLTLSVLWLRPESRNCPGQNPSVPSRFLPVSCKIFPLSPLGFTTIFVLSPHSGAMTFGEVDNGQRGPAGRRKVHAPYTGLLGWRTARTGQQEPHSLFQVAAVPRSLPEAEAVISHSRAEGREISGPGGRGGSGSELLVPEGSALGVAMAVPSTLQSMAKASLAVVTTYGQCIHLP